MSNMNEGVAHEPEVDVDQVDCVQPASVKRKRGSVGASGVPQWSTDVKCRLAEFALDPDQDEENFKALCKSLQVEYLRAKTFVTKERKRDPVLVTREKLKSLSYTQIEELQEGLRDCCETAKTLRRQRAALAATHELDRNEKKVVGQQRPMYLQNKFIPNKMGIKTSDVESAKLYKDVYMSLGTI